MRERDTVGEKACGDGAACFKKTATVRGGGSFSCRFLLRGNTTSKHAAILPRCGVMPVTFTRAGIDVRWNLSWVTSYAVS
jgi:hypothetical protein